MANFFGKLGTLSGSIVRYHCPLGGNEAVLGVQHQANDPAMPKNLYFLGLTKKFSYNTIHT